MSLAFVRDGDMFFPLAKVLEVFFMGEQSKAKQRDLQSLAKQSKAISVIRDQNMGEQNKAMQVRSFGAKHGRGKQSKAKRFLSFGTKYYYGRAKQSKEISVIRHRI